MPTKNNNTKPYKIATGNLLRLWRESIGLSQRELHLLAQYYELPLYDSQISHFERAQLEPKSEFFVALGQLNKIFEEGEFSKVIDQVIKDKIIGSPTIRHTDKKVYSGSYWFACFTGEINPPREYTLLTKEEAQEFSNLCRSHFEKKWKSSKNQREAKRSIWSIFLKNLEKNNWSKSLVSKISDVLNDLDDFNADEVKELTDKKGNNILIKTLQSI